MLANLFPINCRPLYQILLFPHSYGARERYSRKLEMESLKGGNKKMELCLHILRVSSFSLRTNIREIRQVFGYEIIHAKILP